MLLKQAQKELEEKAMKLQKLDISTAVASSQIATSTRASPGKVMQQLILIIFGALAATVFWFGYQTYQHERSQIREAKVFMRSPL